MLRFFTVCLLLCETFPDLRADETLRQVQRELRSRRIYFGPADGHDSPETKAAVAQFQRERALDATGQTDEETLRELGLRQGQVQSAASRAMQLGREWLSRYWKACEARSWQIEEHFYAERLQYYSEGLIPRDSLREKRAGEYAHWPVQQTRSLLVYASWNPRRADELWVSTRAHFEMKDAAGMPTEVTEELLFILRVSDGEWHAVEIREWPLR